MISDGFDADNDTVSIMASKLTSERARERTDAMAAIRARYRDHGIPITHCSTIVEAVCGRLALEAAGGKKEYAQSKAAAAVRDCKWAVQCTLQACNGRLDPALVRTVIKTVCSLASDQECLGEFVGSICNRQIFTNELLSVTVWAVTHGDGLWEKVVGSVLKAMTTVSGQRRQSVYNEADLLAFLGHLFMNPPRRNLFFDHAVRVMQIALQSFKWSAELPDLATFSACVELIFRICKEADREGLLVELVEHFDGLTLRDHAMWSWIKHRALAHQTSAAEWLLFLHEHKIVIDPPSNVVEMIIDEVSAGKLCSVNLSAVELMTSPPSAYSRFLEYIGMLIPVERLLTLTCTRFPEYRMFQILAASRHRLSCELLVEKLEKSGRDSQPFVLLCLIHSMADTQSIPEHLPIRVFKNCGIVALKAECREAALVLMTLLLSNYLEQLDYESVDQQVELLLAVMDSKEPNLRFTELCLSYLEKRFRVEYWTLTGRKMYEKVTNWMYSYAVNLFPVDLLYRFLRLPFTPLPHPDNSMWNMFLAPTAPPVVFDGELYTRLVQCHSLSVSLCEDLIKVAVRHLETPSIAHKLDHQQVLDGEQNHHSLTIVDSLYHSPQYRPSPEVLTLSTIHAILQKSHSASDSQTSAFLRDAQKYLCRKVSGLEPFQFKAFVEGISGPCLVDSACIGQFITCLLHEPRQLNPAFVECALKIIKDCNVEDVSPPLVKYLYSTIQTGKIKCTEEHVKILSRFLAEKTVFVEFIECANVDIDALYEISGLNETAFVKTMLGKVNNVGVSRFMEWCNSRFLKQRGHLFVELLYQRWSNSLKNPNLLLDRLDPVLVKLVPSVIKRMLEDDLTVAESVLTHPRIFSPLFVKHVKHIDDNILESCDYAIEAYKLAARSRLKKGVDKYMMMAFSIYQDIAILQSSLTLSDWFLCFCQYSRLFEYYPFDALLLLQKAVSNRNRIHDTVMDQIFRSALVLQLAVDMKKEIVMEVVKSIKQHRITHLPTAFPVLLLYYSILGFEEDDLFKDYIPVVRLCQGQSVTGLESKYTETVIQILSHCHDDALFTHILTCAGNTLKGSAQIKRLCEQKTIITDWQVSSTPSTGLVESMFKSLLGCGQLYPFVKWALSFKANLRLDGLAELDMKLYEFLMTAEPFKMPVEDFDPHLPKHLAAALVINPDQNIQAEIYYHAFVSMEEDAQAVSSLSTYLPSVLTVDVFKKVLIKIISYCGRSAELLCKHHQSLYNAYTVLHWNHNEHLSAAYCFEALRLTSDYEDLLVESAIEHFKAVDHDNTLDRRIDHVAKLTSLSVDNSQRRFDGVEMVILGPEWDNENIPSTLSSSPRDRLLYSQAKLSIPPSSQDPLLLMAIQARHDRIDTKTFLSWLDTNDSSDTRLVKMTDLVGKFYDDPSILFASGLMAGKLLRHRGQSDDAVQVVKTLLHLHQVALLRESPALLGRGLSKLGRWLEEGKAALPKDILESYLEPAYKLAPANSPAAAKALYRLAWFLDRQYSELESSDLLQAKADYIQYSKRQLELMRSGGPTATRSSRTDKQLDRNVQLLEMQLSIDQEEYNRLVRDKTGYLVRLLESYLKVLQMSTDKDVVVFRFCSLWFAASGDDLEAINVRVAPILAAVPSHKFLPCVYQLAAKYQTLSPQCRQHALLTTLLRRLIFKHPFHSVMQFIALSFGAVLPSSAGQKRTASNSLDSPDTTNNARDLLSVVRSAKATAQTIKAIEQCAAAYIELAELPVDPETMGRLGSGSGGVLINIPKNMLIHRLASSVPLLTVHLEPNAEGNYTDAITVHSVDPQFRVIGGINLPKVVDIVGSDGKRYRQLVKARDDLRQDAVVEQVFRLVNRMIQQNAGSALRCYRVVPLHQRAGVLEWVADAVPIGDYLHSAHSRYHPHDWSLPHCRQLARQEAERPGSTLASKLACFNDIQAHLNPCFHRFFLERFLSTEQWLQARLQYSMSCASSSIMGHVIGLGDRHCQNILIDCRTGQLCHIDLNMIFEQGRTLRIPERVPFRLTRSIVSAMGVKGVDHGFRNFATQFLHQIRQHADNVIMVLEVFKHDPLHHWPSTMVNNNKRGISTAAIAFDKLSDLQSPHVSPIVVTNSINPNDRFDMADRALLRIKEKVSGREEGAQISVSAQVEYLIQQATSAESLCQMYCGWQPWL